MTYHSFDSPVDMLKVWMIFFSFVQPDLAIFANLSDNCSPYQRPFVFTDFDEIILAQKTHLFGIAIVLKVLPIAPLLKMDIDKFIKFYLYECIGCCLICMPQLLLRFFDAREICGRYEKGLQTGHFPSQIVDWWRFECTVAVGRQPFCSTVSLVLSSLVLQSQVARSHHVPLSRARSDHQRIFSSLLFVKKYHWSAWRAN